MFCVRSTAVMNLLTLPRTEAKAIAFLQQRGLLHTNRICPRCACMMRMRLGTRNRWRCTGRKCPKDIELRVGTYFARQHITFVQAVWFIYKWHMR